MTTTKTSKRVKCGGCGRSMPQGAPKNRDSQGKSWHYNCLADACGTQIKGGRN